MPKTPSFWPFVFAMVAIVAASNFLVRFPFNHFGLGQVLTWGAFSYPVAFLVTDLANRRLGVLGARKVVVAGFVIAVILSIGLATVRIAIASGMAFLVAQLLDITIFDRLRRHAWWRPPLFSSIVSSALDTVIFFSLAFAANFAFLDLAFGNPDGSLAVPVPFFGGEVPLWASLAVGDYVVKLLLGFLMLGPYGLFMPFWGTLEAGEPQ
jgi:uncharacterized PurR-regulated membrane protein YhhQ (DUF165 family)